MEVTTRMGIIEGYIVPAGTIIKDITIVVAAFAINGAGPVIANPTLRMTHFLLIQTRLTVSYFRWRHCFR